MEQKPEAFAEYDEFDFQELIDTVYKATYEILNEEEFTDEEKWEQMRFTVASANNYLDQHDVMYCGAVINSDALVLQEGADEYMPVNGQVYGQYQGLVLSHEPIEGTDLSYYRIYHAVEIEHIESEEDVTELFGADEAYLPLESGEIEVLRAPFTCLSDEEQLQDLCNALYSPPEEGLQTYHLTEMFERIYAQSTDAHKRQKNIDWLLDQLDYFTGMKDEELTVYTSEYFESTLEEPESAFILSQEEKLEGVVAGFAEMEDYYVDIQNGFVPKPLPGKKILALYIQTLDQEAHTIRLRKIPLRMCSQILDKESVEQE